MKLSFGLMVNIDCMTGSVSPAGQMAGIFCGLTPRPIAKANLKNVTCLASFDKRDRPNLSKYGRLLDAFMLKTA